MNVHCKYHNAGFSFQIFNQEEAFDNVDISLDDLYGSIYFNISLIWGLSEQSFIKSHMVITKSSDLRSGMVGLWLKVCAVEDKTAIVTVAFYQSILKNSVRFKSLSCTYFTLFHKGSHIIATPDFAFCNDRVVSGKAPLIVPSSMPKTRENLYSPVFLFYVKTLVFYGYPVESCSWTNLMSCDW